MNPIQLPNKFDIREGQGPNSIEFILEPCFQGYGTTLGNALRRMLLSSIPGAAVTAVKIKGVDHEFSTIPHIKEDIVQILLNLKQLRMRIHSLEPVRLHLYAKGEKTVTAKDIEPDAQVEIINPNLVIATLTNKNAELDMTITAEQGRGYITVEEKTKKGLEIGTITIDSIFTPIRNVGFKVEPTRVGEITNFDKLIMTIETDGTIDPKDALKYAARVLIDHFQLIENMGQKKEIVVEPALEKTTEEKQVEAEEKKEATEELEEKPKKRGRKKKIAQQ